MEAGWYCTGGSSSQPDYCYTKDPEIESIEVTANNNLVIRFSDIVYISDTLTTDDIEITIQKYDGTYVDNLTVDFTKI